MSQTTWNAVDQLFVTSLLEPDVALDAALEATEAAGLPAISVAPNQGKLLHLLVRSLRAKTILEIGTLGGYSTIWLARALPTGGRLTTLEIDPHHAEVARHNLAEAGLGNLVDIRVGPALDTLEALAVEKVEPYDFVFVDADKTHNADYVRHAVGLARPGAVIVVDNVARGGAVADDASTDVDVLGVRRLLDYLAREPRLDATAVQTVGTKGYDGFVLALVTGP